LTAKPPTITQAKVTVQPEVGIRRDRPFASHYVADALRRNANVFCQPVFGQAQGLQKLFFEHLTWRDGEDGTHFNVPLVIVHDFNVSSAVLGPNKAQAPLGIDSNAVLALAIMLHFLQTISWRYLEVIQNYGPIQLGKLAKCRALDIDPAPYTTAFKK
jgi:hypothetical protein